MLPKSEFLRLASAGAPFSAEELAQVESQYEAAAEAARQLRSAMPAIGFLSAAKRLNAFFAVCRHIDQLVDTGHITEAEGQLSLLIFRVADPSFKKASTVFELRGNRFEADARAEMPRAARQYLAGLQIYG